MRVDVNLSVLEAKVGQANVVKLLAEDGNANA